MAEAILMKGGGTVYSEDCTAVATDILDGKTALHLGSNDEIDAGSMPNNRNSITQYSNTTARVVSSSIQIGKIAEGYYDATSTVSAPITSVFGDAVPSQVLSGSNFLHVAEKTVTTGSMPNYAGVTTIVGGTGDKPSTNTIRIRIAKPGYYNANSYVRTSLSDFGNALGTVSRGYVVNGMTFTSTAGVATSGTMKNFNGTDTETATSFISEGSVWIKSLSNTGYYTSTSSVNTQIPVYGGTTATA